MAPDVVTTIAYQKCLAANVRFLGEECVVVTVLTIEHFAGFQLERTVLLCAGIASRHFDIHVLVVKHLALRVDV